MSEDERDWKDPEIWKKIGEMADELMRDSLDRMKENAPIPSWKRPIYIDWYYERPFDAQMDWCWIGPHQVPFLTTADPYVPKIPGWGALKKGSTFCDCGDRGCTGGLVVTD